MHSKSLDAIIPEKHILSYLIAWYGKDEPIQIVLYVKLSTLSTKVFPVARALTIDYFHATVGADVVVYVK